MNYQINSLKPKLFLSNI